MSEQRNPVIVRFCLVLSLAIVMTTSDNEDYIGFCYAVVASSYIVEPSSYSELLGIVSVLKSDWIDTAVLPTKQKCHD